MSWGVVEGNGHCRESTSEAGHILATQRKDIPVEEDGQTVFSISPPPQIPGKADFYVNGQKLTVNKDYTLDNVGVLTILPGSGYALEITDQLEIKYL